MGPEAAGKEPVTVSVLHHVAAADAGGGKGSAHELGPGGDVALRVADHGGLACGAGGGVHPHHPVKGHGEKAEGVVETQIFLGGEGQPTEIGE